MRFKNLPLSYVFNCLLNFHLLFFLLKTWKRTLMRYAHPGTFLLVKILMISHCQYVIPLMNLSQSLSLSDSSEDELFFLFLDPLFFFLEEYFLSFFWPSLFFTSTLL